MRVRAKEASITLLVGGVPLQMVPVRDLVVREARPRSERYITGQGWSITLECVGEGAVFDALWYDLVHHQTALARWADDGGPVPS